jgi:dTDP-4-dehydrorhamnose reductase
MANVVILGSTGMLGSAITEVLTSKSGKIIEANRSGIPVVKTNECIAIDATEKIDFGQVFEGLRPDFIINAIGMIKQVINERDPSDLQKAQTINCDFVSRLNEFSESREVPVIQIGTDCVFSGARGNYVESDLFEATDVYSKTKIAGESKSPSSMILRTSIIGREMRNSHSLLEWVLSHEKRGEVNGFTNHTWNGVTTFHFANLVKGIIEADEFSPGTFHVMPTGTVSKYQLIQSIAENFERSDLTINKLDAPIAIDRTLATLNPAFNRRIWAQAGYDIIPDIEDMVSEYANWLVGPRLLE